MVTSHITFRKQLSKSIREMFLDFGVEEILMSARDIKETFFPGYEESFIQRALNEDSSLKTLISSSKVPIRYTYPRWFRHQASARIRVDIQALGRPYRFKKKYFVPSESADQNSNFRGTAKNDSTHGLLFSLFGILAIFWVFLVLKMAGTIHWSWWWISSPLWLTALFFIALITFICFVVYRNDHH